MFYFFLAFLGGLILNFMPCVLPVISLKLFSLVRARDKSHSFIAKHNLLYSLGILITFLTLALIIIGLKNAGEQVGWGFQMQSPFFVFIMSSIIFILAINMWGGFEFQTPGGRKLGGINLNDHSPIHALLGGVFATILSTPCSAPFLGTALTFAFNAPSFIILLIFLFIGLGLSLPFLLIAIFPNLIKILPKPGNWMNILKQILGIFLFITFIWLLDVLFSLTNYERVIPLLVIFLGQCAFLLSKGKLKWGSLILILLPLYSFNIIKNEISYTEEIWSPQLIKEAKKNSQLVFMDFTAKWCVTCKVNEKFVIHTEAFKNLQKKYQFRFMLGDWTKKDPQITEFLKKNGIHGVPAYFIQTKEGKLISLGETITIEKIEKIITNL